MVATPAGNPAAYDVLVGLHVACAVIGFGTVAVSGAYGAIARRAGGGGATESRDEVARFFAGPLRAQYLLVAAPVFGVAAMALRPGGQEYGQVWAVAGLVIWVLASLLLVRVVLPSERAVRDTMRPRVPVGGSLAEAGEGEVVPLRPAGGRLMWAAAASDVMFVVALMMMVIQPR